MEGNWIILEEDGWKIVIPEIDKKPHSTQKNGKRRTLAWSKCLCNPKVDFSAQMIVHNSFEDAAKVKQAMQKLEVE